MPPTAEPGPTLYVRLTDTEIRLIDRRAAELQRNQPPALARSARALVVGAALAPVLDDLEAGCHELTVTESTGILIRRKYALDSSLDRRLTSASARTGHRRQRIVRAALTRLAGDEPG